MLPAILFSIGVIGWIVLVLEMLVAAPIWAFSHVLPEGDGLLGSSGRAGYFHALDILARPTLMVFGLFLAILVVNAAAWFLGTGLQIAFASSMQGSVVGIWSALMELVIVMAVVYLMANKSVHLISVVPGKVMRWIGQSLGVGDEIQEERNVNALVAGRIGGVGRPVGSAGDRSVSQKFTDAKDPNRGRNSSAAAPRGETGNANAAEQQSSQAPVNETKSGAGGAAGGADGAGSKKLSDPNAGGSGSAQARSNEAEAAAGANPLS